MIMRTYYYYIVTIIYIIITIIYIYKIHIIFGVAVASSGVHCGTVVIIDMHQTSSVPLAVCAPSPQFGDCSSPETTKQLTPDNEFKIIRAEKSFDYIPHPAYQSKLRVID